MTHLTSKFLDVNKLCYFRYIFTQKNHCKYNYVCTKVMLIPVSGRKEGDRPLVSLSNGMMLFVNVIWLLADVHEKT
jgi:hypothetical protein